MTAILHDEPPELADSAKNVPVELDRLIRTCLEKNPRRGFIPPTTCPMPYVPCSATPGMRSSL